MARERLEADDPSEASLLDRRSYLKMAGTAAAAVAAGSANATAAGQSVGYGEGQYGQMAYGGGTSGGPSESAPTVERFDVSTSERLGDDRMFSVNWTVSDAGADLDVVEVVVHEGVTDVNFSVLDVSGGRASGWELFKFPVGSDLDVTIRAKDATDKVAKKTQTLSL